jgi:hypothetical protein
MIVEENGGFLKIRPGSAIDPTAQNQLTRNALPGRIDPPSHAPNHLLQRDTENLSVSQGTPLPILGQFLYSTFPIIEL